MKKPTVIVIGFVLLSGIAWLVVDRPARDHREAPVSPSGPPGQEVPAVAESAQPVSEQPVPSTTAGNEFAAPADPNAWEIIEYGEFVSVREYRRNCETVLHFLGAGEGDEVTTCERKFEIDHPYALFTDAQLAQIAASDGEAAFVLAHRQLFPAEPGGSRDIESAVNNLLGAMIRGGERQALDLMLDEAVFSPHTDLRSFLLWTMVGEQLGIASPEQVGRMLVFRDVASHTDIESIEQKAAEIAGLLRDQRLIVLGTEF
jgi:hypothetical protein